MKHNGGRISYNCQAAVDEKEGVIVAAGITEEEETKVVVSNLDEHKP